MKELTEEEKIARSERLRNVMRELDEYLESIGVKVTYGQKVGQHFVTVTHHIPHAQKDPNEKKISEMTEEEFKEKAMKELMERYGYSKEQAEAAVNNPY